jgi:hypothetical protein
VIGASPALAVCRLLVLWKSAIQVEILIRVWPNIQPENRSFGRCKTERPRDVDLRHVLASTFGAMTVKTRLASVM